MTPFLRFWTVFGWLTPVLFFVLSVPLAQAEAGRKKTAQNGEDVSAPPAKTVDLFGALEERRIVAQIVPHDHTLVRLVLANRSNEPLVVEMPPALGAVPVPSILAQQRLARQPNAPRTADAVSASDNSSPQPLGIWPQNNNSANSRPGAGPQNRNNGLNLGNGNRGGPLFNVLGEMDRGAALWNVMDDGGHGGPLMNVAGTSSAGLSLKILPNQSAPVLLHGVCLAFGHPTPSPKMAYQIKPLELLSSKPEVRRLLMIVGSEDIPQRVAQPAAWHLANGLPWEKLIDHSSRAGMRTQSMRFSATEIRAAQELVERAKAAPATPQLDNVLQRS